MRSTRLLAIATGVLVLGTACGGDDPVDPVNANPVASFTEVCTGLSCVFTDTSVDSDGTVTVRSWNFGDGSPLSPTTSPTHVYEADGTYTVELTVTDNDGGTGVFSKPITVAAVPGGNVAPTAGIEVTTACTAGTPCGFQSTSTDSDGEIVSTLWNFGDQGTAEGPNATHTYAAAGTYTVTLTVTDDDGATATATAQVIVAPAASQDCTTTGTEVECSLTMTQRVTVKFTIESTDCELTGNRLETTAPAPAQIVFFHLCNRQAGEEYTLRDGTGAPLVLPAGTVLDILFDQGTTGPADPPSGDPGIEVDGSYPTWTLRIDDGGNAGAAGEPDFDDAIIRVQATLAP